MNDRKMKKIVNYSHSPSMLQTSFHKEKKIKEKKLFILKYKMYNCNQHKSSRRIIREMRRDKGEREEKNQMLISPLKTQS